MWFMYISRYLILLSTVELYFTRGRSIKIYWLPSLDCSQIEGYLIIHPKYKKWHFFSKNICMSARSCDLVMATVSLEVHGWLKIDSWTFPPDLVSWDTEFGQMWCQQRLCLIQDMRKRLLIVVISGLIVVLNRILVFDV